MIAVVSSSSRPASAVRALVVAITLAVVLPASAQQGSGTPGTAATDIKLHVVEGEITIEDLEEADEVFLSNSIHNIRWVQCIGDKKYDNKCTQKIFSSFHSTIS